MVNVGQILACGDQQVSEGYNMRVTKPASEQHTNGLGLRLLYIVLSDGWYIHGTDRE